MTTKQWAPPKGWRWMAGMRLKTICGRLDLRITKVNYGFVQYSGGHSEEMSCSEANETCRPDFTDPATLGCLLALVREAWDDERLSTTYATGIDMRGQWAVWFSGFIPQKARLLNKRYPTEAEALLAALEAAP